MATGEASVRLRAVVLARSRGECVLDRAVRACRVAATALGLHAVDATPSTRRTVHASTPSTRKWTPRRYGGVNIFHLFDSLPFNTSAKAPKRLVPPSVVAIASRNSFAN